jgi:hypothetical protein
MDNPAKLISVADTATSALTTDTGLGSVGRLVGLADSTRHLGSRQVRMVTLPVRYAPRDPNRVQPIDTGAAMVWNALQADKPIPAAATKGSVAEVTVVGEVGRSGPGSPGPAR